jgi:hypothetical protein
MPKRGVFRGYIALFDPEKEGWERWVAHQRKNRIFRTSLAALPVLARRWPYDGT